MMPRWLRIIRGMIGTGLTFAAGVGVVGSIIGLVGLLVGELSVPQLIRNVGRMSVVAFLVGVVFSGALAIAARSRRFDRLSLRFVTGLGAAGGLLYFLFVAAMNGARVWSAADAFRNLAILVFLGGGSAAGTLILARRARQALTSGEESDNLDEGRIETPLPRRGTEHPSRL
jgi:hypothetical protein